MVVSADDDGPSPGGVLLERSMASVSLASLGPLTVLEGDGQF